MPLINRLSRLFTADLNAVLDRIEEPAVLARQALRDMEHEINEMLQRASNLRRERDAAHAQIESERRALIHLDEELDMCFAAGEDDLARNLVRRKLQASQREKHLVRRGELAANAHSELERCIVESQNELAGAREKLDLLATSPTADGYPINCPSTVASEEIEIAFLREKQRRARS